jgi:hypothetical protein
MVEPYVHWFAEPVEGLEHQLEELKGYVQIVPDLIEADRQRRWDEISERPADDESETIDVYTDEAHPGEGGGFADFSGTTYAAATVFGWETFVAFLIEEIVEHIRPWLEDCEGELDWLATQESQFTRRFNDLKDAYQDWAQIRIADVDEWNTLLEFADCRHALVHNSGRYTKKFFRRSRLRPENVFCSDPTEDSLVNSEQIPLTPDYVTALLDAAISSAKQVSASFAALTRDQVNSFGVKIREAAGCLDPQPETTQGSGNGTS